MSENRSNSNRARLAEYYGTKSNNEGPAVPSALPEKAPSTIESQYDIDSPSFDSDLYSQKVMKEASMSELMYKEGDIVRQIHSLDSDMQTLVYENYNKFIAATDTIKQMRVDFKGMEGEMDQLAEKMKILRERSESVNSALKGKRAKVADLSSTHALLKKLQFLFELPKKLKTCIEEDNLKDGVQFYVKAERVLLQYEHMPSFHGIKKDCDLIVQELKNKLRDRLKDPESSPQKMGESVHLLIQLKEPVNDLCDDYLLTSKVKLQESLESLQRQVEVAANSEVDVLEFANQACDGFISDLSLVLAAFNETFNLEDALVCQTLNTFVIDLMAEFMSIMERRLIHEKDLTESAILARALDRIVRRVHSLIRLLPKNPNVGSMTLTKECMSVVLNVTKHVCQVALQDLGSKLDEELLEIRKIMVTPRAANNMDLGLRSLNRKLISGLNERLRSTLTHLQLFLDRELSFALKQNFRVTFCRSAVREGVVIGHLKHVLTIANDLCSDDTTDRTVPPLLLLLLSRTCLDLQAATIQNLISCVDEQFEIDDNCGGLTSASRFGASFKAMSQELLNHYARLEGGVLSQMLRKSVETRDWLNNVEPRSVRAVMKRIVEETTNMDRQVGELYEEGSRKARSSDSSRRTRLSHRSHQRSWVAAANASFASNIQKMFNEKIEIFSLVEASKVSILTGIVKMALKTLLECVRMKTFSRFGFQQMQVDVHYLNLYIWRFVSDENLVMFMLDEVMTSAVHRCPDPIPMEQSVVDVICDRS